MVFTLLNIHPRRHRKYVSLHRGGGSTGLSGTWGQAGQQQLELSARVLTVFGGHQTFS